jgi:hypothetical protein
MTSGGGKNMEGRIPGVIFILQVRAWLKASRNWLINRNNFLSFKYSNSAQKPLNTVRLRILRPIVKIPSI